MDDIYNELNTYLRGSSKTGINETIASFLLTWLNDVPNMRASDIAERCHTSTPSVIRFCRELGYDGYADFKDAVDTYCQNVDAEYLTMRVPLQVLGSNADFTASIEQWTRQMHEYALRTLLTVYRPQMLRLAQEIVTYPQVYVFGIGISGIVAEQLRIRLARRGKIIIVMPGAHTDLPLTENKAETLGIIISQHARLLSEQHAGSGLLPYLKRYCAKTWLITQEPPDRRFAVDELLHILPNKNHEAENHSLLYAEEMLGECCCQLLEKQL